MPQVVDQIVIVMLENQYRNYVMQDPFMAKLARAGLCLENSFGCFHPSQTNYVAFLAGELCGVTNDTAPAVPLPQRNLVDLLEEKNVTWKAYLEAYPNEKWRPEWAQDDYQAALQPVTKAPDGNTELARYFRKHNAFASFKTIQSDPDRWAKIVDETQFWQDVMSDELPAFSWFSPDIWNDGHYLYNTHIDTNPRTQLIPQISSWLEHIFLGTIPSAKIAGGATSGLDQWGFGLDIDALLSDPAAAWKASNVPPGTLIVITFDEADFDAIGYDTSYDGPNQIYTVLLGDMIEPGSTWDGPINHYGLLRTVERNFELGSLGKNDSSAPYIHSLWNEQFMWEAPQDLAFADTVCKFDGASIGGDTVLTCADPTGALSSRVCCAETWSDPHPIGSLAATDFCLATCGTTVLLVAVDAAGSVVFTTSRNGRKWSDPETVPNVGARHMALCGYEDHDDGSSKAMLCWQSDNGFIQSSVFAGGTWLAPQPTGQLSDGSMALCQFGPSLFLVYKERNRQTMRMSSFNLAEFNSFPALKFDDTPARDADTSIHRWSPFDIPVGHFSQKFAALQSDYRSVGPLSLAAIAGEMRLIHRAAYADTPQAYSETFGLTGILTASSAASNGYGTLDQAGWTAQTQLADVQLDPDGQHALISNEARFTFIWQERGNRRLRLRHGGYRQIRTRALK